jgi:cystathionine beta-lyase
MDFNFDEILPRRNTNSIKWDANPAENMLPMWVADMDFKTAPAIEQALQNRVSHGVFGYTLTPPKFYTSISNWWEKRHGLPVPEDWIIPVNGVIPALSALIKALTQNGDKIIIQPPVYNHFFTTIENSGCHAVENNLIYTNGDYTIDFEDLEIKAADAEVKLLLLSNPHNPAGRVFKKEELLRVGEICLKHNIVVVSDEIHSDLVYQGYQHVPFASLSNANSTNCITLSSPSKTFNLAGLQVGYLFTENAAFKTKIESVLTVQEMELLSPFAIEALIAAYNEGAYWLEALKAYLLNNYEHLKEFIRLHLPQIKVVPLQATYLVWLDCSALAVSSDELSKRLLTNALLWVNSGTMYGSAGDGFLRINIACPMPLLVDGLNRLKNNLQ